MIEIGDTVQVQYDDGRVIVGTVTWIPQGAGDSWQVHGLSGDEYVINVYYSKFLWMRKQAQIPNEIEE